jgi:four helix bundle protein
LVFGEKPLDDLFVFEKLEVYQVALDFARKVYLICNEIRDKRNWSDQLSRAATSIPLNIAEGAGRWHAREKKNFYFIAKGSVFECVPLIDLGLTLRIFDESRREELRKDCSSIAKMLTKLIQSLENNS